MKDSAAGTKYRDTLMNYSTEKNINNEILEAIPLVSPKIIEIKPGLNSNAYQLTDGKEKLFLKIYKEDRGGLRLKRETYFLKMAEILGIKNTPRLISTSRRLNFCALSWVEGTIIASASRSDWESQINFIGHMQKVMNCNLKNDAPYAADAFFTLRGHRDKAVSRLQQSLEKIKKINCNLPIEYMESIISLSNTLYEATHIMLKEQDEDERSELIVMSPSDIGFHNSLKMASKCVFFDFEYAGVDDMYKLLADWCLQPDWQPPLNLIRLFLDHLIEGKRRHIFDPRRAVTMLRIYQIKWISIILDSSHKVTNTENKIYYLKKAGSYIHEMNERFEEYSKAFYRYS